MSFINSLNPLQRDLYIEEHKHSRAASIKWNVSYARELNARDEQDKIFNEDRKNRAFAALAVKPTSKVKVRTVDFENIVAGFVRVVHVSGVEATIEPNPNSERLLKITLHGTSPEAAQSLKQHLGAKFRISQGSKYYSVPRSNLNQTTLTQASFRLA